MSEVDLTNRAIGIGESANGTLIAGRQDRWWLDAAGGESVQINMDADFDTYLELYGPDGTEIARNDDFNGLNAQINVTLPSAGTYTIIARAFADARGGAYRLSVSTVSTNTSAVVGSVVGGVTRNADWTPVVQEFDGVPMVQVPAGCFLMGSNDGSDDERPVHGQCFDEPFWIDQTEVTQADFERLGGVAANPSQFSGDQRPVESITWFEARDFCALRGARLPTEAEWEYAARGPDALVYPWGNEWNEDNAVWNRSSSQGTANVGSIPAGRSWVGAFDLSGNVWEWMSSLYENYPYDQADGRERDTGNSTNVLRVLRGGSWYYLNSDNLRSAYRGWIYPGSRDFISGFRCARSR